jgi:hypothetical protein
MGDSAAAGDGVCGGESFEAAVVVVVVVVANKSTNSALVSTGDATF